jgi:DnaA family protein
MSVQGMTQLALDIQLGSPPSLENFVTGENALVLQHLRLLTQSANPSPVPTYFWGMSGSGKTHLLQAVRALAQSRGEAVAWLDTTVKQPVAFDARWRWVLLDDVDRYDTLQQHAAFSWLAQAINPPAGEVHTVVACGEVSPAHLPLREDLRTRLGWGHIHEVKALNDEAMSEVLQAHAQTMGLKLSPDVITYILSRFSRNLRSLLELLVRLDAYALQHQRAVTIPLLRDMMENWS